MTTPALTLDTISAYKGLDSLERINLMGGYQDQLLEELGEHFVHIVKERIQSTKENPYGRDWQEWADGTRRQREYKGNTAQGLLWDTGDLLHSITFETGPNEVRIGSPLDYAKWLQDGTENMPAREFLGFSPDDLIAIDRIVDDYLHRITI